MTRLTPRMAALAATLMLSCVEAETGLYRCDDRGRCPRGQVCVRGLCFAEDEAPDAGDAGGQDAAQVDSRAPDRALSDRAPADLGLDANREETGAFDHATPDLGTPDLGTPDLDTLDQGSPDQGAPDLDSPDHASADVGLDAASVEGGAADGTATDHGPADLAVGVDQLGADATPPCSCAPEPDVTAICVGDDLDLIRGDLVGRFRLCGDITLDAPLVPVGRVGDSDPVPFSGELDGAGFTITGLAVDRPDEMSVGLFAAMVGPGSIHDLTLVDPQVSGLALAGALVGFALQGAHIEGCHVRGGSVTSSSDQSAFGGLIGVAATGTLVGGCTVDAATVVDAPGASAVGGLIGSVLNATSTVHHCHAAATVTGSRSVGGLIGSASGMLESSSAAGVVEGGSHVGGLVGDVSQAELFQVTAAGTVTGETFVGGLVGSALDGVAVYGGSAVVTVVGAERVGGLAGALLALADGDPVVLRDVRCEGEVQGIDEVGGLVGYTIDNTEVNNGLAAVTLLVTPGDGVEVGGVVGHLGSTASVNASFYDADLVVAALDDPRGEGRSPETLFTIDPYLAAGWSVDSDPEGPTIWFIAGDGQSYPQLRWQLHE